MDDRNAHQRIFDHLQDIDWQCQEIRKENISLNQREKINNIEEKLPKIRNLVKELVTFQEKIVVNGIDFYYHPEKIEITEGVKKELKEYAQPPLRDSTFVIYRDKDEGLVIY